jgi:uncharacterized protein (TIGR02145 family)
MTIRSSVKAFAIVLFVLITALVMQSCKKDKSTPPILTTTEPTSITQTTVTSGGNVTSDGGAEVIVAGICWSTSPGPSVKGIHTNDGKGLGSFTSNLTGLTPNTKYYIRAYAYNEAGTGYGNEISLTTLGQAPEVTTQAATNLTGSSATLNATINPNWLATTVTFEYGTTSSYGTTVTAEQNPVAGGSDTLVNSIITGLLPKTTYHFRVKAVNNLGTTIGEELIFTTLSINQISDIEGNVYNTIQIGTQLWMKENLKVTKYRDGSLIPIVANMTSWSGLSSGACCWINNDPVTYANTYGALYNWYTTDDDNLCPIGWHVPTDADWTILTDFLDGLDVAGGKLKEVGTAHWESPNTGATNEFGFTALPSGSRSNYGGFYDFGRYGYWWSSSEISTVVASHRGVQYDGSNVFVVANDKRFGFSIRCLKD